MSHCLKAVAEVPLWNGWLGADKLLQLFSISALVITVTGCGSPTNLDVLAYDACIARHPQEVALCEGPREAYELEPTTLQARAVGTDAPKNSNCEGRSALAQPVLRPVPPLNAIASGRSE